MRNSLIAFLIAVGLVAACKDSTGPEEQVLKGDGPTSTGLAVVTTAALVSGAAANISTVDVGAVDALSQVFVFDQVETTLYGRRSFELHFTAANGCSVDITLPYYPGIYPVDATAVPTGPTHGVLQCTMLGGTKRLTGEIVVMSSAVDFDAGYAVLELMVGKLAWEGSGLAHFGNNAGVYARAAQPVDTSTTGGTPGSVVCPNVPSGYWCVSVGGSTAPVKWKGLVKGPSGSWQNPDFGACINFNASTGVSTFTMSGGIGGGATTYTGKWGALVNSSGTVTVANGTYNYIYTGAQDPQITLLTWNTATLGFFEPGWVQGGC